VQIYYTEVDDDAYTRSVKDPEDVVAHMAHETNEWAYGQCQKIKARVQLQVPGLNHQPKAGESDEYNTGKQPAKTLWVYEGSNLVYTSVGASIYGFNFRTGQRVLNWEKLHKQYISQFLFLPDRAQAITVCEAPTALLWKLDSWCAPVATQSTRGCSLHEYACCVLALGSRNLNFRPYANELVTSVLLVPGT
jgi:hypothetical protein